VKTRKQLRSGACAVGFGAMLDASVAKFGDEGPHAARWQRLMTRGLVGVAFVIVACYALAAPAELPPTAAEVREMLQANGVWDLGAQIGPVSAQQFSLALRKTNPDLPARADAVIEDVVVSYLRKQAEVDHVPDRLIPIYAKYLTKSDVQRIVEFYHSPAGRKLVSATPGISLESAKVGQEWIQSILPGLRAQLLDRLKYEKLIP
jgi:hypothetical protein